MWLTLKITVAMGAGFLLVLLGGGYHEIRQGVAREIRIRRERQELIARAIAPVIARSWRLEGDLAAHYLVSYLQQLQPELRLRLVKTARDAPPRYRPHPSAARLRLDTQHGITSLSVGDAGAGAQILLSYVEVPIAKAGEPRLWLELLSDLPRLDQLGQATLERAARPLALSAAVSALVTLLVGAVLVWRPIRSLLRHADRVGTGDFTSRLRIRQHDELGTLGREMNRMSDRLQANKARLEREVAERERAQEQLRHADRLATIGTLASGFAHELGTPLQVARGHARAIEDDAQAPEESRRGARVIVRQCDAIAKVIRQLLDFSRRERSEREQVNLKTLVAETVTMLEPLARKGSVQLATWADAGPLTLSADPTQLRQALVNLVVNAIQASDSGTTTVGVCRRLARPPMAGSAAPVADHLCLVVDDEGRGVPPELRAHLFEPFVTTKEVGEGTGLGLFVVYGIVRDHGGWVEVDAKAGRGTRFSVYLPEARS